MPRDSLPSFMMVHLRMICDCEAEYTAAVDGESRCSIVATRLPFAVAVAVTNVVVVVVAVALADSTSSITNDSFSSFRHAFHVIPSLTVARS